MTHLYINGLEVTILIMTVKIAGKKPLLRKYNKQKGCFLDNRPLEICVLVQ